MGWPQIDYWHKAQYSYCVQLDNVQQASRWTHLSRGGSICLYYNIAIAMQRGTQKTVFHTSQCIHIPGHAPLVPLSLQVTISVSGRFNHAPIATDHGSMDRRRALTDAAKAAISGRYVIFSAGNLPRTCLPNWLTKFIVKGHSWSV